MGGFLAIDFGLKQTGLAYADEEGIAISKLPILQSQKPDFLAKLLEIIQEKNPKVIVIGFPFGFENELSREIQKLTQILQDKFPNIKFVYWDEYGSTKLAEKLYAQLKGKYTKQIKKIRKKKQDIDSISAQLILYSYLNSLLNFPEATDPF